MVGSFVDNLALLFIGIESSFFSEILDRPIYQFLHYNFSIFYAFISAIYVLIAILIAHAVQRLVGHSVRGRLMSTRVFLGFAIQWSLFYVCLFIVPPSNF